MPSYKYPPIRHQLWDICACLEQGRGHLEAKYEAGIDLGSKYQERHWCRHWWTSVRTISPNHPRTAGQKCFRPFCPSVKCSRLNKNAQHFCKTLIDITVWMVTACTTHPMKTNSVFIFEGRSFYWFEKRADLKSLHDHSEICPFSIKFTFGEYFTCFGLQGFHEIRLQNLTRHIAVAKIEIIWQNLMGYFAEL